MYYEEQMIDGVLCWRISPTDPFTAYTVAELGTKILALQKEVRILRAAYEGE